MKTKRLKSVTEKKKTFLGFEETKEMSFNLDTRELDGAKNQRLFELRVRAKDVAFFVWVRKRVFWSEQTLIFVLSWVDVETVGYVLR